MNYLQEAKDHAERSFGDVRDVAHRDRLVQVAMMYAAIAQAEALTRIAAVMEAERGDVERKAYLQELHAALADDPVFD